MALLELPDALLETILCLAADRKPAIACRALTLIATGDAFYWATTDAMQRMPACSMCGAEAFARCGVCSLAYVCDSPVCAERYATSHLAAGLCARLAGERSREADLAHATRNRFPMFTSPSCRIKMHVIELNAIPRSERLTDLSFENLSHYVERDIYVFADEQTTMDCFLWRIAALLQVPADSIMLFRGYMERPQPDMICTPGELDEGLAAKTVFDIYDSDLPDDECPYFFVAAKASAHTSPVRRLAPGALVANAITGLVTTTVGRQIVEVDRAVIKLSRGQFIDGVRHYGGVPGSGPRIFAVDDPERRPDQGDPRAQLACGGGWRVLSCDGFESTDLATIVGHSISHAGFAEWRRGRPLLSGGAASVDDRDKATTGPVITLDDGRVLFAVTKESANSAPATVGVAMANIADRGDTTYYGPNAAPADAWNKRSSRISARRAAARDSLAAIDDGLAAGSAVARAMLDLSIGAEFASESDSSVPLGSNHWDDWPSDGGDYKPPEEDPDRVGTLGPADGESVEDFATRLTAFFRARARTDAERARDNFV